MIKTFLNLADELGINYHPSLAKKLQFADSEDVLILQMEKRLENSLFSYSFQSGNISKNISIQNHFILLIDNSYVLVRYIDGNYYNKKKVVSLSDYVGCRYFELREIPKKISPDSLVSAVIHNTPLWSVLFLLLTPFALITPIYTNIFNTRLIYSSSSYTLIVVSSFFFLAYIFEFISKKKIKEYCIEANAKSAILFERYILKHVHFYRNFSSVHSIKTVEQYRKMVWDFIPLVASDVLSFLMFFIVLSVFVSWLSIFFLIFYLIVFGLFYFYRTRLYKHMIDLEASSNDVLKIRVSSVQRRLDLPFLNKFSLYKKYSSTYSVAQHYDDTITKFNFYWDELTKVVSFLALFLLFVICFISVSNSELNPAYMIVLFIISSRLSGLISQIVIKLSYLKVGLYHLNQSMDSLFNEEQLTVTPGKLGIKIDHLDKIKVQGLNIVFNSEQLLTNVQVKFHRGILYGVRGSVGSGKSTLLKTLVGLNKEYKGKIEYDGIDINAVDDNFFNENVSYLSAESDFISGSLYENFIYRKCFSGATIGKILKECFGNRVFDYQSLYVDDVESIPMSTGQRRKLLFMMTLFSHSSVYIFDEPLINLSKSEILKVIQLMRQFAENSIIILTSHNESILSSCDTVYELSDKAVTLGLVIKNLSNRSVST